jgi:hypothetical protein
MPEEEFSQVSEMLLYIPSEQMDDWEVNKLPLWGRAGMPSELAPSYVSQRVISA